MHYYDEDDRDRDREKLSWKDIDHLRDGTKKGDKKEHETSDRPGRTSYANKKYKKKLEEFFSIGKKKEDKQQLEELKKVKDIKSKSQYMKAADEYIEKYGMPKDLDFLLALFDHKDNQKVAESVRMIEAIFKEESETRQEMIRQKIHILEMTHTDPKIQGLAEETLVRINA